MSDPRKSMSVKPDVHERFRKRAARLSTQKRRVTISELVEFLSKYLENVTLVDIEALQK